MTEDKLKRLEQRRKSLSVFSREWLWGETDTDTTKQPKSIHVNTEEIGNHNTQEVDSDSYLNFLLQKLNEASASDDPETEKIDLEHLVAKEQPSSEELNAIASLIDHWEDDFSRTYPSHHNATELDAIKRIDNLTAELKKNTNIKTKNKKKHNEKSGFFSMFSFPDDNEIDTENRARDPLEKYRLNQEELAYKRQIELEETLSTFTQDSSIGYKIRAYDDRIRSLQRDPEVLIKLSGLRKRIADLEVELRTVTNILRPKIDEFANPVERFFEDHAIPPMDDPLNVENRTEDVTEKYTLKRLLEEIKEQQSKISQDYIQHGHMGVGDYGLSDAIENYWRIRQRSNPEVLEAEYRLEIQSLSDQIKRAEDLAEEQREQAKLLYDRYSKYGLSQDKHTRLQDFNMAMVALYTLLYGSVVHLQDGAPDESGLFILTAFNPLLYFATKCARAGIKGMRRNKVYILICSLLTASIFIPADFLELSAFTFGEVKVIGYTLIGMMISGFLHNLHMNSYIWDKFYKDRPRDIAKRLPLKTFGLHMVDYVRIYYIGCVVFLVMTGTYCVLKNANLHMLILRFFGWNV